MGCSCAKHGAWKTAQKTPYQPKGNRIWDVRERDGEIGTGDSLILDDDYYY